MKLILILMGGMFSMPGSGYDDSYEFTVKIEEEELGASVMAPGNEEMLIVGRHDNNTSEERFKLKAVTEFKPNNSGYVEQVNPAQRTYRWKCGGNVNVYDQEKQVAEFVTGEETWGQEFDIEVTATTMIVGKKKKQISADGKKKAIAPKIVLKSAHSAKREEAADLPFWKLSGGSRYLRRNISGMMKEERKKNRPQVFWPAKRFVMSLNLK